MRLENADSRKPIVGPDADEGWREKTPEMYTLDDGRPLYLALLANPNVPVPPDEEIIDAKVYLRDMLFKYARAEVIACQGKSLAEAQEILQTARALVPARLQ